MRNKQKLQEEPISDDEIINIIKENLSFLQKKPTLKNFLIQLKRKNFKAIQHFKYIRPMMSPKMLKNIESDAGKVMALLTRVELADNMFRSGATVDEVYRELKLPKTLMAYLLRSYYVEAPKELIQFKLLQYRLYGIMNDMKSFFVSVVNPALKVQQKTLINGILSSMIDMASTSSQERNMLDIYTNGIHK